MTGRKQSAEDLYGRISSDSRVRANLQALRSGSPLPSNALTLDDLFRADLARPWPQTLRSLAIPDYLLITIGLMVLTLIFAAPAMVRPQSSGNVGWFHRLICLALPGVYDLRHGSPLAGLLIFWLVAFALLTGLLGLVNWPMPGFATGIDAPRGEFQWWWAASLLNPEIVESVGLSYRGRLFLAVPLAKELWLSAFVCGLIGLGVHLRRLPKILRLGRSPAGGHEAGTGGASNGESLEN
jgi:hypothetical protein